MTGSSVKGEKDGVAVAPTPGIVCCFRSLARAKKKKKKSQSTIAFSSFFISFFRPSL
jgi:hypothetical protein